MGTRSETATASAPPPTVFGKLVSVEEKETEAESGVKDDQRDQVKEEDEAEVRNMSSVCSLKKKSFGPISRIPRLQSLLNITIIPKRRLMLPLMATEAKPSPMNQRKLPRNRQVMRMTAKRIKLRMKPTGEKINFSTFE